jgi:tripartite-type tricarboxylate transporter receptor subunit TctC
MKPFLSMWACALFAGDSVVAQPHSAKAVRIINAFRLGGSLDLVSRLLAKGMTGE